MPRLSRRAVLLIGLLLGLALWLVPAFLFGDPDPWDDPNPAYAIALLACGFLLGFLGPGYLFAAVAAVFAGQLVVLLSRVLSSAQTSELWAVSAMMLGGYTFVVTGLGAFLGSFLRRRLSPTGGDRRVSDRRT